MATHSPHNEALETSNPHSPRDEALETRNPARATRKATFNLPTSEIAELQALARDRQTTATQVIRQAISTELYLQGLIDQGARLLYRFRRGSLMEIVFPHMRRRSSDEPH